MSLTQKLCNCRVFNFGKNHHYLLNEKNEINYEGLNNFLKKIQS